jgi:hypothetical protein
MYCREFVITFMYPQPNPETRKVPTWACHSENRIIVDKSPLGTGAGNSVNLSSILLHTL